MLLLTSFPCSWPEPYFFIIPQCAGVDFGFTINSHEPHHSFRGYIGKTRPIFSQLVVVLNEALGYLIDYLLVSACPGSSRIAFSVPVTKSSSVCFGKTPRAKQSTAIGTRIATSRELASE